MAKKEKAPKKPTIPLGDILNAINRKDRGFYNRLSDELKKSFSPWMMMRYASSINDSTYAPFGIFLVNEIVNVNFSDIPEKDHKELQWLAFTAASVGTSQTYTYIKPPNARKKKDKVFQFLLDLYPTRKLSDIELLLELNTKEDLRELAKNMGFTDKELKETFGK